MGRGRDAGNQALQNQKSIFNTTLLAGPHRAVHKGRRAIAGHRLRHISGVQRYDLTICVLELFDPHRAQLRLPHSGSLYFVYFPLFRRIFLAARRKLVA